MKTLLRLIEKDITRFLKDKPGFVLTFVVPMVLIIIFGSIFGDNGSPRGKSSIILVDESNTLVSRLIVSRLDSSETIRPVKSYRSEETQKEVKFTETSAMKWVKEGKFAAAIVMPEDFFTDTSTAVKFKFYYDPKNEIESAMIRGDLEQNIMSQIPRLLPVLIQRNALSALGRDSVKTIIRKIGGVLDRYLDIPVDTFVNRTMNIDSSSLYSKSVGTSKDGNILSRIVKFDSKQLVGEQISNPWLTRTVGGWAVMFLLFSLTGAANSLFEERQEGTLKRLMCMPLTRTQILLGKYLYTMLLGVVQLSVLFFFSWVFFRVDIFSNFFNLFIVIICSVAAAVSFGMLITSVAKSLSQAASISTLVVLIMSAVGGSWFPTSILPDWMQVLSKATITYWSVEAFQQVLWRQSSIGPIMINIFVLLTIALLINSFALIRFKKGNIL